MVKGVYNLAMCKVQLFLLTIIAQAAIFCLPLEAQNKESGTDKPLQRTQNGSPMAPKVKQANIEDCPVKVTIRPEGYEVATPTYVQQSKANLVISTNTIKLKHIELHDLQLNIPAFKQFKANKTDFTADGEQEFKQLVDKLKLFFGTDHSGKSFTLFITGSASQVPTSFDPSKPNNNLKPDGGSIPGKTSIENNKLLAQARANELAKRIKHLFPNVHIQTPELKDIVLGSTPWDQATQLKLLDAKKKRDKRKQEEVLASFEKDQWVKVQCNEKTSKTIEPQVLKMYMASTTPSLKSQIEGKEQNVKTVFIISKHTYDKIGKNHSFGTVSERDRFIKKLGLKIFFLDKDSVKRWYLLSGKQEIQAYNTEPYDKKVFALFKAGAADVLDQAIIYKELKNEAEQLYK